MGERHAGGRAEGGLRELSQRQRGGDHRRADVAVTRLRDLQKSSCVRARRTVLSCAALTGLTVGALWCDARWRTPRDAAARGFVKRTETGAESSMESASATPM